VRTEGPGFRGGRHHGARRRGIAAFRHGVRNGAPFVGHAQGQETKPGSPLQSPDKIKAGVGRVRFAIEDRGRRFPAGEIHAVQIADPLGQGVVDMQPVRAGRVHDDLGLAHEHRVPSFRVERHGDAEDVFARLDFFRRKRHLPVCQPDIAGAGRQDLSRGIDADPASLD